MESGITVILPVYNTGKYLSRCLDSVLGQTFADFELLAIDDGSSDDSASILDEYASGDSRMRVIHLPENHGVPYARNLAMEQAGGEYIYFMDSDDWIDPDYLAEMLSHARSTGQNVVINSNWIYEYDDSSKNKHSDQSGFIKGEAGYCSPLLVQSGFFPVVWARLYKLEYLKINNIKSPLLKGGVEDNYFTAMAEILQDRSYIFQGPCYHYYQREGSLVRQPDVSFNYFKNFRVFLDDLHARGIAPSRAKRFYLLDSLEVIDKERFDFMRDYFSDVRQDVLACPNIYSEFDVFAMKAFLSCSTYEEFIKRYSRNPFDSFRVKVFRNKSYPTVTQILNGDWSM